MPHSALSIGRGFTGRLPTGALVLEGCDVRRDAARGPQQVCQLVPLHRHRHRRSGSGAACALPAAPRAVALGRAVTRRS
jgi:hypothetical protein